MPSQKRRKKYKTNNISLTILTNISLMKDMSRRSFLKAGTAATAALAMAPADVLGKAKNAKKPAQTGKIKLLGVGVGGRGHADINGVTYKGKGEVYDDIEFIGMCDVDWKYAKGVLDEYQKLFPNMKCYNDYKKMYAELLDKADAVICGTADHTHAIICAEALAAGKHVYCEKPLTRTVYESGHKVWNVLKKCTKSPAL